MAQDYPAATADAPQADVRTLRREYDALRQADNDRLLRYTTHEAEYVAARGVPMDDTTDYGRKPKNALDVKAHNIPMPYVHAITTKHAFRVAGRLPDLICDRRDSSPPERFRADTIEKILYASYGYSKPKMQFASAAHDGSLHGAGVLDVRWDPDYQLPCFRSIGPGGVHVVPGLEDPHDFVRAYRCWKMPIETFRATYAGREFAGGLTADKVTADDGDKQMVTLVQAWDAHYTYRFVRDTLISVAAHNCGFVPLVVIPNLGPIRELWGYSDYEFYRHAAAYYQTLLGRQADLIRAVANGGYTEDGTGADATDIQKVVRVGGVLPIRQGSSVKPIEVAKMPDFAPQHIDAIRNVVGDLGFAPPAAFGAIGASSGSDRALQLAPQIELTALKQVHWEAGLKRLNTMILKLVESKTMGQSVSYRGKGRNGGAFAITVDAAAKQLEDNLKHSGAFDDAGQAYQIPSTPKQLIDGDYETEAVFQQRLDRDDPQFILAEINKFNAAAQSLRTTLEHLGVENPEDEMKLIEDESMRFPWLRSGMIALVKAQQDAQNQQDAPSDQTTPPAAGDASGGLSSLLGDGGGVSGALNFDGLSRGVNGSDNGGGQTADSAPGAQYGGA